MKQTATEWLFNKLLETPKDKFEWYSILKEAKEMEKEQMITFTADWYRQYKDDKLAVMQYYNETYEK